jgi:adenylate kinase family enzyme
VRIAIVGSPRAGKTTLALAMGRETGWLVLHTDDWMGSGWSAVSERAALVLGDARDLVIEGVAVVRGLRKALAAAPGPPVERCIVLERPRVELTRGQRAMQRGCARILQDIEPELVRRGVLVERAP